MTEGVAQDKVRKAGRGTVIMSFVSHSKKLTFHLVGTDLMQGINCISKRSLWRRWEAGKLPQRSSQQMM